MYLFVTILEIIVFYSEVVNDTPDPMLVGLMVALKSKNGTIDYYFSAVDLCCVPIYYY